MDSAVRERPEWRAPLVRLARRAALTGGWLLMSWGVAAGFGVTGRIAWFLEIPANFPLLSIGGAGAGLASILFLSRALAARLLAVLLAISNGIGWATTRPSITRAHPGDGPEIRLMEWNTLVGSVDAESAAHEILRMNPDLVAFTEFTFKLHDRIDPLLRKAYPYYLGSPEKGFMGRAVYSRFSISDWQRDRKDARRLSSCVVTLPDGFQFRVFILHTNVPVREGYTMRGEALRLATAEIAKTNMPAVAVGDFNASWASADLRKFCRDNHFFPASLLRPTWNAGFPFFLRTGIDHVLVPDANFESVSAQAGGGGSGSDHLPIMATVRVREPDSISRTAVR